MSEFWFRFFYVLVWPFFNLFHPGRSLGRDQVPQGGCILCGNHTRASDPFFVVYSMGPGDHPYILGKAELMRWPGLRWILRKVGVIPVDRSKSDIKAIKECIRILKDGKKLLLFPEGTRSKSGYTQAAKTGAAMLALRTGVPIVPFWIPAKKRWFRRTPVIYGAPYYPQIPQGQKPTAEDYRQVADDLLARIVALGGEPSAS